MITATSNPYELNCLSCHLPFAAHSERGDCPLLPEAITLLLSVDQPNLGCKVRVPKVGFDA